MKQYKLLRDLPRAKAGAIYEGNLDDVKMKQLRICYFDKDRNIIDDYILIEMLTIENNVPTINFMDNYGLFEEVKEEKPDHQKQAEMGKNFRESLTPTESPNKYSGYPNILEEIEKLKDENGTLKENVKQFQDTMQYRVKSTMPHSNSKQWTDTDMIDFYLVGIRGIYTIDVVAAELERYKRLNQK